MKTAFRSFEYSTSNVLRRFQGRSCSTATFVAHVCGHLKSGSIALRSKDCCRIDSFRVGICDTPVLKGDQRRALAPGFEMTLPTQTNGTRPVKMPEPPRNKRLRLPRTSQLKPTRGENIAVAPGSVA